MKKIALFLSFLAAVATAYAYKTMRSVHIPSLICSCGDCGGDHGGDNDRK